MEELFLGTVASFKKQRGFGYVTPDDQSMLGDKVFCHWKSIKTSDKWPHLTDGMRVAFQAEQDDKKGWKTTEVYTEEGEEVTMDEPIVLLKKGKKYKGICKSYSKGKGVGVIMPNGNGPWPKTGVKVLRSDINGDGGTPYLTKDQRVQFQLTKEDSGYRAVNVTLPGGKNIPIEGASGNQAKSDKHVKKQSKKSEVKKQSGKSNVKKAKKKESRKRQLSQASKRKNSPAKKKSNHDVENKDTGSLIVPSQIPSGAYGGMEVAAEDVIEVGLIMKSQWVGSLIGKKGATIKEIKKLSEANMKFGDDEIEIGTGLYKVFAVSGTMNQVADACKIVAIKLGEASLALEYKIVFLVPDIYCGMFVGKKGATINEVRGNMDERVRVELSQDPILLPGSSKVTLCTVFGPRQNVQRAIERTVAVLGAISTRLKKQMMEPVQQWGDDRWGNSHQAERQPARWQQNRGHGEAAWGGGRRGGRW